MTLYCVKHCSSWISLQVRGLEGRGTKRGDVFVCTASWPSWFSLRYVEIFTYLCILSFILHIEMNPSLCVYIVRSSVVEYMPNCSELNSRVCRVDRSEHCLMLWRRLTSLWPLLVAVKLLHSAREHVFRKMWTTNSRITLLYTVGTVFYEAVCCSVSYIWRLEMWEVQYSTPVRYTCEGTVVWGTHVRKCHSKVSRVIVNIKTRRLGV